LAFLKKSGKLNISQSFTFLDC